MKYCTRSLRFQAFGVSFQNSIFTFTRAVTSHVAWFLLGMDLYLGGIELMMQPCSRLLDWNGFYDGFERITFLC